MATILAGAALLRYVQGEAASAASRAIYEAVFEAVSQGVRTADLRGDATTHGFTDDVIRRVETKLDV